MTAPGFESLMDAVRSGRVNCIVVKDLSRFGRDYVEAGNLLEIIFPRLGVRFISIGDNYDSFDPRCKGEGMSVALKNMINSFYAKDISQKIRSAFAVKSRNGQFVGKVAPFGYVKSPEDKNRLVVDGDAAEIVRRIFHMKLDGLSVHQITRTLSAEGVPNPGYYRYIKGIHKEKRYEQPQAWDISVVKKILEDITYLGHLAMGKTRTLGGKQYDVPKEEWVITENTHAAIVSRADFDTVAEQLRQTAERHAAQNRHQRDELPEYILQGITFCADCGRAYRRIPNTHRDKTTYRLTYICPHCNRNSPKYTYQHFRQDELYDTIYEMIHKQIVSGSNLRRRLADVASSSTAKHQRNEREEKEKAIRQRLDRVSVMKKRAHDDFCEGTLDKREYSLLFRKYDEEQAALSSQLCALTSEQQKFEPRYIDNNPWVSAAERFINEKELTREMLLALVKRIEVSGNRTVEVIFNYRDEYRELLEFIEESEAKLA